MLHVMKDSRAVTKRKHVMFATTLSTPMSLTADDRFSTDKVIISCGGQHVMPKSAVSLQIEVCGCKIVIPTLVVQGQHDEMILGTNVIKHIIC